MTGSARELIDAVQAELAPRDDENRLVPSVAAGEAARGIFAAIAAEEYRIVRSDWRSFLHLASRARERNAREFFVALASGEGLALGKLPSLAEESPGFEPRAGCQAYPAFVAWLALNGEPADVIVAIVANFAAFGRYCAAIAAAMRERYGFDDEACAFFDFFGAPSPELEELAVRAVQAALDAGKLSEKDARTHARLFQAYELDFWNTLADDDHRD
ncbi:transcriptional regulator [Amycolatopsis sp. WAC 01376]|uniref:transcriptional regulator n=1 Tax=Amycolatopsis sp. WAC 01376 TaxID=2203195 RepID=UPI000F79F6A5|nr:transcriptional regulator [Amycolatopsis sp. WAC 01376]RSM62990.1 transcriptional regulator [Amycolatopsis sp. WAC 01376]